MYGHTYIGIGLVVGVVALILAAAFGLGAAVFALIVVAGFILLAVVPFVGRRLAGGSPEPEGRAEGIDEVGDPNAPSDATPKAPHGYTPST
jgi:hypothetical protein